MGGVDKSDHLISIYDTLRKTIFFEDVVFPYYDRYCLCEQLYFIFRLAKNLDRFDLIRNKSYHQLDFSEELVRLLRNIGEDDQVPVAGPNIIPKHSIMPEATISQT